MLQSLCDFWISLTVYNNLTSLHQLEAQWKKNIMLFPPKHSEILKLKKCSKDEGEMKKVDDEVLTVNVSMLTLFPFVVYLKQVLRLS